MNKITITISPITGSQLDLSVLKTDSANSLKKSDLRTAMYAKGPDISFIPRESTERRYIGRQPVTARQLPHAVVQNWNWSPSSEIRVTSVWEFKRFLDRWLSGKKLLNVKCINGYYSLDPLIQLVADSSENYSDNDDCDYDNGFMDMSEEVANTSYDSSSLVEAFRTLAEILKHLSCALVHYNSKRPNRC